MYIVIGMVVCIATVCYAYCFAPPAKKIADEIFYDPLNGQAQREVDRHEAKLGESVDGKD